MHLIESSGCLITDRRYALALNWHEEGDLAAAIELLEQTAEMSGNWPPLFFKLGELHMEAGSRDSAIVFFKKYLELDASDRQGAIIKLALLAAAPQPCALPDGYVESLFDQYAPRFEKALIENLSYNVPTLLAALVEEVKPASGQTERVLDLGCGTGLAGETFFKRASWLEGVDISGGMLAEAGRKQVFHRLIQSEILEFLSFHDVDQKFDLIAAADVLVYIGALDELFAKILNRLAAAGVFAFSVQKLMEGEFLLQMDHRYAHSLEYIRSCADKAGLRILSCRETVLRKDGGSDVNGYIIACARQAVLSEAPAAVSLTEAVQSK